MKSGVRCTLQQTILSIILKDIFKGPVSLSLVCRIALTKLDILDIIDEIKIGVAYLKDGTKMEHFPGK